MSAPDAFLDTNVIVYLLSADTRKADIAEALVAAGGIVSVQVLNEAVAVARRKLALPWAEIRAWLAAVRACCRVVPLTEADHAPRARPRDASRPGMVRRADRRQPRCTAGRAPC